MNNKVTKFIVFAVLAFLLVSCGDPGIVQKEKAQQDAGVSAIITNQPVPDLGGYSFERNVVIQTYLA